MSRFMAWTQLGSALYVCAKFEADISVRSNVIRGSQKNRNLVTWPRPRPLWGRFMIRTQLGSALYGFAKFEADISVRSKVVSGSQNFEIRSCDPGHAHLGVVLLSGRNRGPSPMSVPNLKHISLFFSKL